jgi:shikimate dehydrogenase
MTRNITLCMIIGDPIGHSLSPALHNAAYKALGIDDRFRYEARQIKPAELGAFMQEVRDRGIRGVSCTAPHKVAIMEYMDQIDPVAARIGAVNTVVNDGGKLKGYNTDWLGIVNPLEKITALKDEKVALLGAGGAARSIAYGLTGKGARLTIFNRTVEYARELAGEFGCDSAPLQNPAAAGRADIIVNATSAGMGAQENITPLPKEYISAGQIVFDSIYAPYETRLLKDAAAQGARVIHGTEMLLGQALEQFRLYTGYDAPEDAMRHALEEALEIR